LFAGHKAYVKGTLGYDKVVSTFGTGILDEEGEVDRRALGAIVFSDEASVYFFHGTYE
jgi:dephospho-CoA kinase